MQYMLMIHDDGSAAQKAPDAEIENFMAAYEAYTTSMVEAGVLRAGERLRPPSSATTVRAPGGKAQVVNGPCAELKEQFGELLHHRRRRPGRSDQMGRALPERPKRGGRGAADLAAVSGGSRTTVAAAAARGSPAKATGVCSRISPRLGATSLRLRMRSPRRLKLR